MEIRKCRIILSYWEQGGPEEVSESDIGKDEVFVYEYKAPDGYEMKVGHGILFDNDWCADGTTSVVQIWLEEKQKWTNLK
jgi:hypothetical protein